MPAVPSPPWTTFLYIQGPTDGGTRGYFTEKKDDLKSFAKANGLKIPSRCRKRKVISTLINNRTIGLLDPSTSASVDPSPKLDASVGLNLPPFESACICVLLVLK